MLIESIRENRDIITGTPYKFVDALKELAKHHLIMDLGVKPTRQPLHPLKAERNTIGEEQIRAPAAGSADILQQLIKSTNPILVLKKNGTRRMCLDYTALHAVMPFGLHNTTTIYRWQMNNCFQQQLAVNPDDRDVVKQRSIITGQEVGFSGVRKT